MPDVTKPGAPARAEFAVPLALLQMFKRDVRVFSAEPHPNGYITFDREMLISILRSNDVEKQHELAKQIEVMGKVGGELVIMQR